MLVLTTFKTKERIKEELEAQFPQVTFEWKDSIDEAGDTLSKAEVIVSYGLDLTDRTIEQAKNLKWLMIVSAGLDDMPLDTIAEKNIQVTNARGISAGPMGEYAIAMLLQVERNAKQLIENEKNHYWTRQVKMEEISEKTMLVAGTGSIGQEVARLAKAFRMKTIGVSRSGQSKEYFDSVGTNDQLNEKLLEADYVVNVLPATSETEDTFGPDQFKAMKERAIFLNMGRGATVDEKALIEALENQEIHHAILDVMEVEPLPSESPLWQMKNTTVTPHLSGISRHYQPRGFEIFKQNLDAYLKGEELPVNQINVKRGY